MQQGGLLRLRPNLQSHDLDHLRENEVKKLIRWNILRNQLHCSPDSIMRRGEYSDEESSWKSGETRGQIILLQTCPGLLHHNPTPPSTSLPLASFSIWDYRPHAQPPAIFQFSEQADKWNWTYLCLDHAVDICVSEINGKSFTQKVLLRTRDKAEDKK